MKSINLLLFSFLCISAYLNGQENREVTILKDHWKFTKGTHNGAIQPTLMIRIGNQFPSLMIGLFQDLLLKVEMDPQVNYHGKMKDGIAIKFMFLSTTKGSKCICFLMESWLFLKYILMGHLWVNGIMDTILFI